jgi:uroporphyrinogen-III decarboxylase
VEYLNKVQEQTTQEMAKSHNLQIIHQCQGRWNFLERLKNLPSQVNELKQSVDE